MIMPRTGHLLDRFAIGLSSLCLLHCLALPLGALALPLLGLATLLPESFHIWMVVVTLPVSGVALLLGHRRHGHRAPTVIALIGIALLGSGAILFGEGALQIVATILGALLLAIAHLRNSSLQRLPSER
jgi:xanthosine utilization system XapX-like protein